MVCSLREKNQLEQVQICSKLEIILTFSRKCLFYRIFTLPIFTLPPFEEPRTLIFVLWIGTSISNVIDEKKVGIVSEQGW